MNNKILFKDLLPLVGDKIVKVLIFASEVDLREIKQFESNEQYLETCGDLEVDCMYSYVNENSVDGMIFNLKSEDYIAD